MIRLHELLQRLMCILFYLDSIGRLRTACIKFHFLYKNDKQHCHKIQSHRVIFCQYTSKQSTKNQHRGFSNRWEHSSCNAVHLRLSTSNDDNTLFDNLYVVYTSNSYENIYGCHATSRVHIYYANYSAAIFTSIVEMNWL